MSTADRGKYAEGVVKKLLKEMEANTFVHHRFPDARAGSFVTAPCDFMTLKEGKLTLIEVKAVEHAYRLPFKNMSVDQCARMRSWRAAGADAWVLVYFAPLKLWRAETVDYFMQREIGGSWNMTHIEPKKLKDLIKEILC